MTPDELEIVKGVINLKAVSSGVAAKGTSAENAIIE